MTLAVPPLTLDLVLFSDNQQLKRFFSLFLFRDSLARATEVVAADPDGLPGPTVAGLVPWLRRGRGPCPGQREPAAARDSAAAISYYREPASDTAPGTVVPYAAEEQAALGQAGRPTLYLHGSADGCTGVELIADAERLLPRARA